MWEHLYTLQLILYTFHSETNGKVYRVSRKQLGTGKFVNQMSKERTHFHIETLDSLKKNKNMSDYLLTPGFELLMVLVVKQYLQFPFTTFIKQI